MTEVDNITDHDGYDYYNSATDDLYLKILDLIYEYQERELITDIDAVGILEWAKHQILSSAFQEEGE